MEDQYKGKNILAWLSYNPNFENDFGKINNICYVYPRIMMEGSEISYLYPEDFPIKGRIAVKTTGGDIAEDVYERFGSLVNVIINEDFVADETKNNWYTFRYNPNYGKSESEIWIETFSGKGYYQVIDVHKDINTLLKERKIPEPDVPIYTTLVLLRSDKKLYGPFDYDTKGGHIELLGVKDNGYYIGEYDARSHADDLFVIKDHYGQDAITLIPRISVKSPNECNVQYDWISKQTLINSYIETMREENAYTRKQLRLLKDSIPRLVELGSNVELTEERKKKLLQLLETGDGYNDHLGDVVQYILEDDGLRKRVIDEILNSRFDQVQEEILTSSPLQKHIHDLKQEEATLERNVEELKKDAEIATEKGIDDTARVSELTEEIEQLKARNQDLSDRVDLAQDMDALAAERDQLKADRDRARESYNEQLIDNSKLQEQFEETLKTFSDEAKQTARILDSKLLEKILRGIGDEPAPEKMIEFEEGLLQEKPMDANDIIKRVTEFIRDRAHREVTSNDVANYLICITQGFITTFAGEPGTGKTSICTLLAKSLGLAAEEPQNRFVDISVERGWSSHKDFIGYYNPLSKKMERSNAAVFDAFVRMDTEYDHDPATIAPYVILLDEANLSPLEHYWAAFLRNCDFKSTSNRSISLGGAETLKLPEHLRFLATVNFDHTTEELSPRYLDRSWVIMLEPGRIDDEVDDDVDNLEDMIAFGTLKSEFSMGKDDTIDEAILDKWNAIQKIFRDRSLQITPRNLKMVKSYCAVACRCMERDTPATKFAPLDYAFSQKILPTINGNGENYRLLVDDLLKECTAQNMPLSTKHLQRMKRIAENNMGFYQFFSR